MILRYYFLLISLSFIACSGQKEISTATDLNGVWIGAGYEFDKGYFLPWPHIINFKSDSIYEVRSLGSDLIHEYKWWQGRMSLNIDTNLYIRNRSFQNDDEHLWIRKPYSRHYFRPKSANINPEDWKMLLEKWWESDREWIYFHESGTLSVVSKIDSLMHTFAWSIDSVNTAIILLKHGNHLSQGMGFTQFPEQLLKINSEAYEVYTWRDTSMQQISYKLSASTFPASVNQADFQLCNKYLYINYPLHRYYYQGTDFEGGNYQLRKIIREKYKVPENVQGKGLVRIRFVVNCVGDTGLFEVLELDENYKETKLDKRISSQLLDICKGLDNWIPGTFRGEGEAVDTYYFITFRIQDGQVVDIFP